MSGGRKFLEKHPAASIFHTPGWLEALRRTYGYEPVAFTTSPPGHPLTNGSPFCQNFQLAQRTPPGVAAILRSLRTAGGKFRTANRTIRCTCEKTSTAKSGNM